MQIDSRVLLHVNLNSTKIFRHRGNLTFSSCENLFEELSQTLLLLLKLVLNNAPLKVVPFFYCVMCRIQKSRFASLILLSYPTNIYTRTVDVVFDVYLQSIESGIETTVRQR